MNNNVIVMFNINQIPDAASRKLKPGTRILVQIPEGLKTRAHEIIDSMEKAGYPSILSNDPCYGACDIRDREAQMAGAQAIIHVGHKMFYKKLSTRVPVIYVPFEIEANYDRKELAKIKELRIGLLSTVNYSYLLDNIAKDIKAMDKTPVIGGSILGCNFQAAKEIENRIDCFLFVGSGKFHATGIRTLYPVYIFDMERNRIELVERKEFDRRKMAVQLKLEKFREAGTVGILLSSKQGQFMGDYMHVKRRVEKLGKRAYVLIMDCITKENLMGLRMDFFINTACPRIAEDNLGKTVINASDFMEYYG